MNDLQMPVGLVGTVREAAAPIAPDWFAPLVARLALIERPKSAAQFAARLVEIAALNAELAAPDDTLFLYAAAVALCGWAECRRLADHHGGTE